MTNEERIQAAINSLDSMMPCSGCGMRYRVGDVECPRCGADLDDILREWAEQLIAKITPDED
jgi:uncharacterized protein (UPF0212 family)